MCMFFSAASWSSFLDWLIVMHGWNWRVFHFNKRKEHMLSQISKFANKLHNNTSLLVYCSSVYSSQSFFRWIVFLNSHRKEYGNFSYFMIRKWKFQILFVTSIQKRWHRTPRSTTPAEMFILILPWNELWRRSDGTWLMKNVHSHYCALCDDVKHSSKC